MWTRPREYSLTELLEHPALGLEMANDGIDRRSLELLLEGEQQRLERPARDKPIVE